MHFRLAVLFFSIFVAFNSALLAQSDSTKAVKNSLEKGAKALQFGVTNNFTLGRFAGSDIAFKRHLNDRTALRVGVGIILNLRSNTRDLSSNNGWLSSSESDDSDNQYGVSFNAAWLNYRSPAKRLSFFWGLGPLLGFDWSASEDLENELLQDSTVRTIDLKQDRTIWEIGGLLLLGTEFFISEELSLTAEYRSSYSYVRIDSEDTRVVVGQNVPESSQRTEFSSNNFRAGLSTVLFGLSAYF